MDILIKKASKKSYWYAKLVGELFEVIKVEEDVYKVKKYTDYPDYVIAPILKEDCKEIIVPPSDPVIRDRRIHRIKEYRVEKANSFKEGSGFNLRQEIKHYEALNRELPVRIIKID